jgi:hypothetical protein
MFYDDFVTLRRYLIDYKFLDRDRGTYWRIGGSVETSAEHRLTDDSTAGDGPR